jgi:hypothetical protein
MSVVGGNFSMMGYSSPSFKCFKVTQFLPFSLDWYIAASASAVNHSAGLLSTQSMVTTPMLTVCPEVLNPAVHAGLSPTPPHLTELNISGNHA